LVTSSVIYCQEESRVSHIQVTASSHQLHSVKSQLFIFTTTEDDLQSNSSWELEEFWEKKSNWALLIFAAAVYIQISQLFHFDSLILGTFERHWRKRWDQK